MDKKLLSLVVLFFLSFVFFIAIVVFNNSLTGLTRAKESTQPSPENSLIFAWPISTKADGRSSVKVDVFVKSTNNKFIPQSRVNLVTNLGQVSPGTQISDQNGDAAFTLISSASGTAEISATINGNIVLTKKVSVKFE